MKQHARKMHEGLGDLEGSSGVGQSLTSYYSGLSLSISGSQVGASVPLQINPLSNYYDGSRDDGFNVLSFSTANNEN